VLVFSSDTAETIPTTLFILEMDGAVYDIAAIRASFLVCAVNHSVHVYNTHIVDVDGQPRLEAVYDGLVVALKVRCCGNLIIVGDIVRSVIVLRFDTNDVQLVEVTRDYNTSWICALEILVDGRLIIAEAGGDLLALGRRCSHSDISKGPCLGPLARMRLGDVVTCFASGLLTSRKSTRSATPLFFGCVSGGIGCIFSIDISKYRLLERLSFAIPPRVTTVDGTFLGVRDTVATTSRAGFIDGEIVEQFLDLPDQAKHQILDRLNLGSDVPETTIQQLTHTFEHVRQLH
jgi:DNA damage-binding protein 1